MSTRRAFLAAGGVGVGALFVGPILGASAMLGGAQAARSGGFAGGCADPDVEHDGDIAATIYAVGVQAGASDRAMLSAFMAAIVESGMQNLDHGDRDSLGVFQQRPSMGWGSPDQLQDPAYAATAYFLGSTAAGSTTGGGNRGSLYWDARLPAAATAGQLAQKTQISAYPSRYDAVRGEAEAALAAATSGAGHVAPATCQQPGGFAPSADAESLIASGRLQLDARHIRDLRHPAMSKPLLGVLAWLCERHTFGVSVVKTGHYRCVGGGNYSGCSQSMHWTYEAIDLHTVDGTPVRQRPDAARQVVLELESVAAAAGIDEVGSPWDRPTPGFFTDGAHQGHIHLGVGAS